MTLPLYHIGPRPPAAFLVLSAEARERIEAEAAAKRGPAFTRAQARRFSLCVFLFLMVCLAAATWGGLK